MTQSSSRPHPHLRIPPGARPPATISPQRQSWLPYNFELNGEPHQSTDSFYLANDGNDHTTPVSSIPFASPPPDESRLYSQNMYYPDSPQRPRSTSFFSPQNAVYAFPEPQIQHTASTSNAAVQPRPQSGPYLSQHPPRGHRQSKSDVGPSPQAETSPYSSVASFSSSTFAAEVRLVLHALWGHMIFTDSLIYSAIY